MSDAVLVTGRSGLSRHRDGPPPRAVGPPCRGHRSHTAANRKAARRRAGQGGRAMGPTSPTSPAVSGCCPRCSRLMVTWPRSSRRCATRSRAGARRVNVDATANLVKAAGAQAIPPRFIRPPALPSTVAPIRGSPTSLTAQTPVRPYDVYSEHKIGPGRSCGNPLWTGDSAPGRGTHRRHADGHRSQPHLLRGRFPSTADCRRSTSATWHKCVRRGDRRRGGGPDPVDQR